MLHLDKLLMLKIEALFVSTTYRVHIQEIKTPIIIYLSESKIFFYLLS